MSFGKISTERCDAWLHCPMVVRSESHYVGRGNINNGLIIPSYKSSKIPSLHKNQVNSQTSKVINKLIEGRRWVSVLQ